MIEFFIREPTSLLLPVETEGKFECRTIQNTTLQWTITVRGQSLSLNSPASKVFLNNIGIRELPTNDQPILKFLLKDYWVTTILH